MTKFNSGCTFCEFIMFFFYIWNTIVSYSYFVWIYNLPIYWFNFKFVCAWNFCLLWTQIHNFHLCLCSPHLYNNYLNYKWMYTLKISNGASFATVESKPNLLNYLLNKYILNLFWSKFNMFEVAWKCKWADAAVWEKIHLQKSLAENLK